MNLLVIDGQGGGIGRSLVERLRAELPFLKIIAVGTNAIATNAMLKAGADAGATGENAVIFNCRSAAVITGPMGIVAANAMMGEITPQMATAITESPAQKILVPVERCSLHVAGCVAKPVARYIDDVADFVKNFYKQQLTGPVPPAALH